MRARREGSGAEIVERNDCTVKQLARTLPLAGTAQPLAVRMLGPRTLERERLGIVQRKRASKAASNEESSATIPTQRAITASSPGFAGGIACAAPARSSRARSDLPDARVRLHEIPGRGHIRLPIAGARKARVHGLELLDRLRGSPDREIQASECAFRSFAVEPKPSLGRNRNRR